jgi:hypothetical protein
VSQQKVAVVTLRLQAHEKGQKLEGQDAVIQAGPYASNARWMLTATSNDRARKLVDGVEGGTLLPGPMKKTGGGTGGNPQVGQGGGSSGSTGGGQWNGDGLRTIK